MIDQAELRLSAVRAFLGRIYLCIRVIKIKAVDNEVYLTVIVDSEPGEDKREEISIAGTEVISDFPDLKQIYEKIEILTGKLPKENVLKEGWIFLRAEGDLAVP